MKRFPELVRGRTSVVARGLILLFLIAIFATQAGAQGTMGPLATAEHRPINTLRDLNQAFIDIVAQVKPCVVTVSTEQVLSVRGANPFGLPFNDDFFNFFFNPRQQPRQDEQPKREFRQRGLGSGVIVSADGQILTNNHVVENADTIIVRTFNGHKYTARVVGTDPKTDIAVLKIDADGLEFLSIGDSDALQVGEMVLAVGSPMSQNLAYTVTQGIVSAKGRSNVGLADYEDFIQTDAAINPGNSGGPLVNLDGELVGINTAIASRTGGFMGIGFAVPSNMAVRIMNSLVSDGRVVRGWLGVMIQDINEELAEAFNLESMDGVLVSDITADSPALRAGFETGDIIIQMDGKPIRNMAQLRNQVAGTAPGTSVKFAVLRDGKKQDLTVLLAELPSNQPITSRGSNYEDLLGFSVSTPTSEMADQYGLDRTAKGVVVTAVDPTGAAYRAGLRNGDMIQAIDRQNIENMDQFTKAVAGKKKGDRLLLLVARQNGKVFITFTL